jgi:large subunit ribosomal protein L11
MPTKKVKTIIKLNLPAGEATPAPPVGPALGQHGLPIMDFVKAYNEQTADKKGQIIPVVITVYEDRTFSFITKLPPVSEMIKKELKIEKGSGQAGRKEAGVLTEQQVEKIAKEKLADLNCGDDLTAAKNIVKGTARSMGIKIE